MKTSLKPLFVELLGALLILMGLGPLNDVRSQEFKTIKFGMINPLTGPASPWGLSAKCSMDATVQLINNKGGITVNGQKYKIEMIHADDKYTVAGGRAAAEKLFYSDKVDFLVGSFGAEPISAWAPLSTKEKKLAVIGGPTWRPKPEWPYLFRIAASDTERSQALCTLMRDKLGCKSVLYIMSDDLVGKLAKENAIKQEKERGLEVKGYLLVPPRAKDFYPFLGKALKEKPDYLHCKLPPGSVALVVKQARELGYKGYVGYPTSMPGNLKKWQRIAGVEASKGFVGIMMSLDEYSPLGLEQYEIFTKICPKYISSDIAYPIQPHVLAMAIEKAQSFDPDDILRVLRTTEFHSLSKTPLKAGGEKTFGIRNHMTVPVPYSMIVGPEKVKYLGSEYVSTP